MSKLNFAALALILASSGCGGKSSVSTPAPSDPTTAVTRFLAAVRAGDLTAMGRVWGNSKGPANSWMASDQLHQRLTVMQTILLHDSTAFEQGGVVAGDSPDERVIRVRLFRNGCMPVVPFTVRRYGAGWLVSAIDLEAAGNPRRPCGPS